MNKFKKEFIEDRINTYIITNESLICYKILTYTFFNGDLIKQFIIFIIAFLFGIIENIFI